MKILYICVFIFGVVKTLPLEPSVQKDGLPKDSELANSTPSEQSPDQTKSPSPIELSKWKSTTDEVTTTETIKNGTNEETPFVSFLPSSKIDEIYHENKHDKGN